MDSPVQQLHRERLVRQHVSVHHQHFERRPVPGREPFEHRRAAS